MVLINCKGCGNSISENAAVCSYCGTPKQQKLSAFTWFVMILLMFGLAGYLASPSDKSTSSIEVNATATLSPEISGPEQAYEQQIAKQFSAHTGAHVGLELAIKANMHTPESYKHLHTVHFDKGDHVAVFTEFLGEYDAGGIVKNEVIAKLGLDGTVLEMIKIK